MIKHVRSVTVYQPSSPRGVVKMIFVAAVGVAAFLTQTIYGNATSDLLRNALLIGGLAATLLGTVGTWLFERNHVKRALREESRRQSLHNDLLCTALSQSTVFIEQAQARGAAPAAIAETRDDILELVLSAAYSLIGDCCSSVCFYRLDTSSPSGTRTLTLDGTFPDAPPFPRPKLILEGPVQHARLFGSVNNRSLLIIEVDAVASTKVPLWSSSGEEYAKLTVVPTFAGGSDYGLLIACTSSKDCFEEVRNANIMRILALQLASCLSS